MIVTLIAVALAASQPSGLDSIAEAHHAIEVGRFDQARAMTAKAVASGAVGDKLDRLLADLAFAVGDDDQALARFEALMVQSPSDGILAEHAGLAALRSRAIDKASTYLRRATVLRGSSWRAWNGLAIVADWQGDWTAADEAYAKAQELAPRSSEVANNKGWSLFARGKWGEALVSLEHAAALDPISKRIAANLELTRAALADGLPERRPSESAAEWAARLNDAGMAARLRGDRRRAIAAFAQAIDARTDWFERAANNLAATESAR